MTRKEFKDLVLECYAEILREKSRLLMEDDKALDKDMVYGEGAELPDSTDQILAKFPTLKHCLERLQTDKFMEFVSGIDWVSPRPTVFRINLKNGQTFNLKWMGKDFEASIQGKKYYLGNLTGFQGALGKLEILYQEGPLGQDEEQPESGGEGGDTGGSGGGAGGGGNFPGQEGGPEGEEPGGAEEPAGEEGAPEAGGEKPEEKGGEDLSTQNIDFEEPGEA